MQPEAVALGKVFCWLAEVEWRSPYERGEKVQGKALVEEIATAFGLDASVRKQIARELARWKDVIAKTDRVDARMLAAMWSGACRASFSVIDLTAA